jgi:hypothetical protein
MQSGGANLLGQTTLRGPTAALTKKRAILFLHHRHNTSSLIKLSEN